MKQTPDSSTLQPHTRGTDITDTFQHKKTKMAEQQVSTPTTQQEHTEKIHTKP
jgi:hypothetical protein